jgi:hypothetical protein
VNLEYLPKTIARYSPGIAIHRSVVCGRHGLNDSCTEREQRTKGHEANMRAHIGLIIDRIENTYGISHKVFQLLKLDSAVNGFAKRGNNMKVQIKYGRKSTEKPREKQAEYQR